MPFYGDLPTEERESDSGSKYLVKVDPTKAKNKAQESPELLSSETAKGEQSSAAATPAKGK